MSETSQLGAIVPPQKESDLVDWVRLWRSRRVGPATFVRLMKEHRTATEALVALPEIARAAGVDDYQTATESVAIVEIRRGRMAGAALIPMGDPRYPGQLYDLIDAPPLLWGLGNMQLLHRPMIAVVGARNCSSLGIRMARKLSADLVENGLVVVSGLARGADTAAHEGAGPDGTVAVFAGGVDVVYPGENAVLAQEIERHGLRLSECAPGARPMARHFLARNRIISGLARAVVVVEAAAKSGSLTTARNALDQGRDVLAVPGNPMDPRAAGCNMLIRDGATLIRSARDVLEAVGPISEQHEQTQKDQLPLENRDQTEGVEKPALQTMILDSLSNGPKTTDQLIQGLQKPASQVSPLVARLETTGTIIRKPGGIMQLS